MGLLNLNEPEKADLEVQKETKDKSFRILVVVGCVLLAIPFASFTYDPSEGDPVLRGRFLGQIAHIIGASLGMLAVPAIISLISRTFTEKWEIVFAVVFLVLFISQVALRFAS